MGVKLFLTSDVLTWCGKTLVDIDLFSDIRRIENALNRQSCTEALAWCSENKAALRKVKVGSSACSSMSRPMTFLPKNPLEFDLRLQEFIELSRIRNLMEAIAYQKKYLIQWQDTHSAQINQAAALLAYTPATAFGPYKVGFQSCRGHTCIHLRSAFVRYGPLDKPCPIFSLGDIQFEYIAHRTTSSPCYVRWPCVIKAPRMLRPRDQECRLPRMR